LIQVHELRLLEMLSPDLQTTVSILSEINGRSNFARSNRIGHNTLFSSGERQRNRIVDVSVAVPTAAASVVCSDVGVTEFQSVATAILWQQQLQLSLSACACIISRCALHDLNSRPFRGKVNVIRELSRTLMTRRLN